MKKTTTNNCLDLIQVGLIFGNYSYIICSITFCQTKVKKGIQKQTVTALGYFLASCFKFLCILTNPSIAQDSSVILLKELWASALIWYRNSINRASWRLYTPTR